MSNGIGEIRLPDGRTVRFIEWVDSPLFSTLDLQHGAAVQDLRLFQYVVGDTVASYAPAGQITPRTANERDTNATMPGGLSASEEFICYSIRPEITVGTLGTTRNFTTEAAPTGGEPIPSPVMLALLNRQLLLRLSLSSRKVVNTPFGYFNTGFGPASLGSLSGFTADATPPEGYAQIGQNYANPGIPSAEAVRAFAIPHTLNGNDKFAVELANPGGTPINFAMPEYSGAGFALKFARIRILLDGLYKRAVAG